jgi:hypothetical protein
MHLNRIDPGKRMVNLSFNQAFAACMSAIFFFFGVKGAKLFCELHFIPIPIKAIYYSNGANNFRMKVLSIFLANDVNTVHIWRTFIFLV